MKTCTELLRTAALEISLLWNGLTEVCQRSENMGQFENRVSPLYKLYQEQSDV